jgi:hypothetical protein
MPDLPARDDADGSGFFAGWSLIGGREDHHVRADGAPSVIIDVLERAT